MGCFSNCCSWEVETDSLGTEPHPVQPLRAQRPVPLSQGAGREGGPASGDYFGERGWTPARHGHRQPSPIAWLGSTIAFGSMWLAAVDGREDGPHTGKILTLPLLVFIQRLVSWTLIVLGAQAPSV